MGTFWGIYLKKKKTSSGEKCFGKRKKSSLKKKKDFPVKMPKIFREKKKKSRAKLGEIFWCNFHLWNDQKKKIQDNSSAQIKLSERKLCKYIKRIKKNSDTELKKYLMRNIVFVKKKKRYFSLKGKNNSINSHVLNEKTHQEKTTFKCETRWKKFQEKGEKCICVFSSRWKFLLK